MARLEVPVGGEPTIVDNYGIAINSSGSKTQVPPKAISLFEAYPDIEEGEIREGTEPALRYRGVLGTLPNFSGQGGGVADFYQQYMRGTQGIYTNNMYIGDNNQYVAYYTDSQNEKHLKIKTSELQLDARDGYINLGDPLLAHIKITDASVEFWQGEETDDEINKTAFIESNQLYIPRSVVLESMDIGENGEDILWRWKKMGNKNLRLMWVGGNE